jgi:hypothetical protein
VEGTGTIDPSGELVVGLSAALKSGILTATGQASHNVDQDATSGSVQVKVGDDRANLTTSGTFTSDGNLRLSLGAHLGNEERFLDFQNTYADGDTEHSITGGYRIGDLGFDVNATQGGDDFSSTFGSTQYFQGGFQRSYVGEDGGGLFSGQQTQVRQGKNSLDLETRDDGADGTLDSVSVKLGIQPSDVARLTLEYGRQLQSRDSNLDDSNLPGVGDFLSGSYKQGFADDWEVGVAATYNLTSNGFQTLSANLGFRDPDEFRAFSLDFSRTWRGGGHSETQLGAMFESTLGEYFIRNTTRFIADDDRLARITNDLHVARPIDDTWAAIVGASVNYDHMSGHANVIPQIGVQYKQIPLTIGYDFESKSAVIGITIPFGPRRR